jgi:hypothetical protein
MVSVHNSIRIAIAPQKPITFKLDPGSKTIGIALVPGEDVIFGAELTHARSSYQS